MYVYVCISSTVSFAGLIKENEVFIRFYSKLIDVLSINSISHYLVSAKIISTEDIEEIDSLKTSKSKNMYVLRIVDKSLKAGITLSFCKLLDIMENYGGDDVTELARTIKKELIEVSGV